MLKCRRVHRLVFGKQRKRCKECDRGRGNARVESSCDRLAPSRLETKENEVILEKERNGQRRSVGTLSQESVGWGRSVALAEGGGYYGVVCEGNPNSGAGGGVARALIGWGTSLGGAIQGPRAISEMRWLTLSVSRRLHSPRDGEVRNLP
jgi:hypothetical protein